MSSRSFCRLMTRFFLLMRTMSNGYSCGFDDSPSGCTTIGSSLLQSIVYSSKNPIVCEPRWIFLIVA